MARYGSRLSRGWLLALLLLLSCDGGTRGSGIGTGFSTLTGSLEAAPLASALRLSGAALQEAGTIVVQVREAPQVRAEVNPATRAFTLSDVPPGDVTLDFVGESTSTLVLYGLPENVSLHLVNVRFQNGVAKPAGFGITPEEGGGADIETTRRKGPAPLEVTFNIADVVVPAPAQVVWTFGDGIRSGQASTAHEYTRAGNYVVEAEVSNGGQKQRAFQVIQVTPAGERALEVTAHADPDRGLPPLNVQFTAEVENAESAVTYLWDFGDSSVPGEGAVVRHAFTEEGLFLVQVTAFDELGGESTDVVQVQVSDGTRPVPLTVTAEVDEPVGTAPHVVHLRATITSSGPVTIEWTFDDGTPPTSEPRPDHTYFVARLYFATVTVTELSTRETVSDQVMIEVH